MFKVINSTFSIIDILLIWLFFKSIVSNNLLYFRSISFKKLSDKLIYLILLLLIRFTWFILLFSILSRVKFFTLERSKSSRTLLSRLISFIFELLVRLMFFKLLLLRLIFVSNGFFDKSILLILLSTKINFFNFLLLLKSKSLIWVFSIDISSNSKFLVKSISLILFGVLNSNNSRLIKSCIPIRLLTIMLSLTKETLTRLAIESFDT